MKYLILTTLLSACSLDTYDSCHVQQPPLDAEDSGVDEDAGLQPFDSTQARVINVGVGDYVRDSGVDKQTNRAAAYGTNR